MSVLQGASDRLAISLSFLCVIHCLAVPLLAVYLPAAIFATLSDEAWHLGLLALVIPCSALAMFLGCQRHKRYQLVLFVTLGVMILLASALWGHDLVGETGERVLVLIGSSVIALGHYLNFRLCCEVREPCECSGNN